MLRIALTGATREMLGDRLQQADAGNATRVIRRIHALLWLAAGVAVAEIAEILAVGEQTREKLKPTHRRASCAHFGSFAAQGSACFPAPRPPRPNSTSYRYNEEHEEDVEDLCSSRE